MRDWRLIPLTAMGFALALALLAAMTGYSFDLGFGWLKFQPAEATITSKEQKQKAASSAVG